jgi:hypothetical protein
MDKGIISAFFIASLLYCVLLLLAIIGVTGTLNPDLPNLWTPGYIWPVLIHSIYGLALFFAIIASGTSALRFSASLMQLDNNDIRILCFPAGIFATLCASLVAQLGTVGQACALLAIVGACSYYCVLMRGARLASYQYITLVVVLAIATGAVFSFIWKPTIEQHTGSMGAADTTIFAGWYYSLKTGIYPFNSLGVEGQVNGYGYFNNLHTFYALALDSLPRFNIYLFNMAGLSTFFVLSATYMLRAFYLYRSSIGCEPLSRTNIVLVTVLFAVASRYSSWIVESPPVAFLTPITLAVLYCVLRAGDNFVKLGFALALAVIGSAISKVVTLSVLGSYTGVKLLQRIFREPKPVYFILLGISACIILFYIAYMMKSFGPQFSTDWELGPEFWPRFVDKGWAQFHKVVPKLLKDLGLVIIVAGVFQLKDIALLTAAVLAATTHFVFPFLFTPTPAALLILIAGYIVAVDRIPRRAQFLLLLGSLAIIPHHWRHDPGSWYPLTLWAFTLCIPVYLTLLPGSGAAKVRIDTAEIQWKHALYAMLLVVLTLTALANDKLRIGKKKLELIPLTLNDIWTRTREKTPDNALIFTDQTGDNRQRLSGWNDYSLMAQRQFYISTWSSGPLRYEVDARRERLSNNEAILSGMLAPTELTLSKRYEGYFAVLSKHRVAPVDFTMIYANSDYVLYRIQSD